MTDIEELKNKINSCYECIRADKIQIEYYTKMKDTWKIAKLQEENIETIKWIRELKEQLAFEEKYLKDRSKGFPKAKKLIKNFVTADIPEEPENFHWEADYSLPFN